MSKSSTTDKSGMIEKPDPWRVPLAVEKIPDTGLHRVLVADQATRDAVADVGGLRAVLSVQASLDVTPMRGGRFQRNGILVYDDCYNSNPDAVRAMVDVLRDTPAERRIAVLGEMLELGRWAEPLHREVGRYVAGAGISVLVGIRGVAQGDRKAPKVLMEQAGAGENAMDQHLRR